jgi:hypothetical protein
LKDCALELKDSDLELEDSALELKDCALELEDLALELEDSALEMEDCALELKDSAPELEIPALEPELRFLEQGVSQRQGKSLFFPDCRANPDFQVREKYGVIRLDFVFFINLSQTYSRTLKLYIVSFCQQILTRGIFRRVESFSSFEAIWPMPMAQWWAGPFLDHWFMNSLAPIEKR